MLMEYDTQFETKPFLSNIKTAIPNIRSIIKRYVRLLLPIGGLRAISTAIGQKMLEIGVDIFQRTPTASITIIVVSFA